MHQPARASLGKHVLVAVVMLGLAALWLGLCALAVASKGDPEAGLKAAFGRYSMADAFKHINGGFFLFWAAHSCLIAAAAAALRLRRLNEFEVLLLGPAMALGICMLSERWSDPNWPDILGICAIGWFVSVVVSMGYWGLRPTTPDQSGHDPT